MADGQEPRPSRGWVVALVVLLVLAALGGGVAAVVILDDEADESGAPRSLGGRVMDGTGYQYALPDGWNDITSDALQADLPEGVDTVSGRGFTFSTSPATIIIERFEVEEGTSTTDVRESWEANLTEERGLKATYVPSLDVDGDPALGRQIRRKVVGGADDILQVAYLVIHEGYGYSIGLNSAEGDSKAGAAFDSVISSWLWDE